MMRSYTAYCTSYEGEKMTMTRDCESKKEFVQLLHDNGYKVSFIALTEKYDEEGQKWNERRERKRRDSAIKRQCEKHWREHDRQREEELEKRLVAEQETTEEETTQEAENMTINNYDEVREQLIEELKDLELRKPNYQTDIYLYIDENGNGKIDTFVNVGGNSWINDDHITIYCDTEHYNTIMDDLSDGGNSWNWLINELENYFKLSGIKEQLFNYLIKTFNEDGDGDAEEYYKDLSDFEYYDIEQALGELYYEEIEKYYKDWFIPECCMDGIELLADEILEEYKK